MKPQAIDVVVAILLKDNGEILLAQRPPGKPYAGYWEFPGGKVEPGESLTHAVRRELHEELGIEITHAEPWCCVAHHYPHAYVHLHFFICRRWLGEPQGLEGQAFAWQGKVQLSPILPATIPLLQDLEQLQSVSIP